jgi:hypothetical protein
MRLVEIACIINKRFLVLFIESVRIEKINKDASKNRKIKIGIRVKAQLPSLPRPRRIAQVLRGYASLK